MTNEESSKIARLIDANLNRLKEGIRVIEDINRYIFDDQSLTASLKNLRHTLQSLYLRERLRYRDIEHDVQKESTGSELSRDTLSDLIIANFSRAQEAARVLEESFKLIDPQKSNRCKEIRYQLYQVEKDFYLAQEV
ncbi:MAG: thiamine-phosphate pyrophosphorylase [Sulfurovum sp.]|nr:MAG: thiamine-phosphate pyrophosphorylase [Sulfurovum sp.]